MNISIRTYRYNYFFKAISVCLIVCFSLLSIMPSEALAQGVFTLPVPGTVVPLSSSFVPVMLRGLQVNLDNPFQFDFIIDSGNSGLAGDELKSESEKLARYFLATLTTPEEDLWVNLSPYESDRIIPEALGHTAMGQDLLAQDYILKQLTASLMIPDSDTGKTFWQKVYAQAYEQYGTIRHLNDGETSSNSQGEFDWANFTVNTFNKVWIVPEKAVVYEDTTRAIITESYLKVMLEEDYLAAQESVKSQESGAKGNLNNITHNSLNMTHSSSESSSGVSLEDRNKLSSDVVREVLLPELEKEVNEGKNFSQLRQMYHAMVLATWYKQALKESIINQVYSDQRKIKGLEVAREQYLVSSKDGSQPLDTNDQIPDTVQIIYQQYLAAYKKGVCNVLKVEYDPNEQRHVPRKYFSGGFGRKGDQAVISSVMRVEPLHRIGVAFTSFIVGALMMVGFALSPAKGYSQMSGDGLTRDYDNITLSNNQFQPSSGNNNERVDKVSNALFAETVIITMQNFKNILSQEQQNSSCSRQIWNRNTRVLQEAYSYILQGNSGELSHAEDQVSDLPPLSKLNQLLQKLKGGHGDNRVDQARSFLDSLNSIHVWGSFDQSKPTLLFIHGADRGVFDTFGRIFNETKNSHNIMFYVYDNYQEIDKISTRLKREIDNLRTERSISLDGVITYSMGGIVWRHFMETYFQEECKCFIEIATPLAGSAKAAWMAATFPEKVLKVANQGVYRMAQTLNPFGLAMQALFSSKSLDHLKLNTYKHVIVVAKNDPHASTRNFVLKKIEGIDFDGFERRYSEALMYGDSVDIDNEEVELDPHTNVVNSSETVSLIVRTLNKKEETSRQDDKSELNFSSDIKDESEGGFHSAVQIKEKTSSSISDLQKFSRDHHCALRAKSLKERLEKLTQDYSLDWVREINDEGYQFLEDLRQYMKDNPLLGDFMGRGGSRAAYDIMNPLASFIAALRTIESQSLLKEQVQKQMEIAKVSIERVFNVLYNFEISQYTEENIKIDGDEVYLDIFGGNKYSSSEVMQSLGQENGVDDKSSVRASSQIAVSELFEHYSKRYDQSIQLWQRAVMQAVQPGAYSSQRIQDREVRKAQANLKKALKLKTDAKKHINQLTKILNESGIDGFLKGIQAMKGGALKEDQLTDLQKTAVSLVLRASKKHPHLKFNLESVFFIPKNSWVNQLLFPAQGRYSAYHMKLAYGNETREVNVIAEDYEKIVNVMDYILHESIHNNFDAGRSKVTPNVRSFFRMMNESMTESLKDEILMDVLMNNQEEILPYLDPIVGEMSKSPSQWKRTVALLSVFAQTYPNERQLLKGILHGSDSASEKDLKEAVATFLITGQEAELKGLMGDRFEEMMNFLKEQDDDDVDSEIKSILHSSEIEEMKIYMAGVILEHKGGKKEFQAADQFLRKVNVRDGLYTILDLIKQVDVNLYEIVNQNIDGTEVATKTERCYKNAMLKVLKELAENKKLSLALKDNFQGAIAAVDRLTTEFLEMNARMGSFKSLGYKPSFAEREIPDVEDFEEDLSETSSSGDATSSAFIKGGIDLNSDNLDLKRTGSSPIQFKLPPEWQGVDLENIPGFVPVIINIVPITNFNALLGLSDDAKQDIDTLSQKERKDSEREQESDTALAYLKR